jgi:hypothetical protein
MTGCLEKGTAANSYMLDNVEGNGPKTIGVVSSTAQGPTLHEAVCDQDGLDHLPIAYDTIAGFRARLLTVLRHPYGTGGRWKRRGMTI